MINYVCSIITINRALIKPSHMITAERLIDKQSLCATRGSIKQRFLVCIGLLLVRFGGTGQSIVCLCMKIFGDGHRNGKISSG